MEINPTSITSLTEKIKLDTEKIIQDTEKINYFTEKIDRKNDQKIIHDFSGFK